MDVRISFPKPGMIQVEGPLFANTSSQPCRQFVACAFEAAEIEQVTVRGGRSPKALLRYCSSKVAAHEVVAKIARFLARGPQASVLALQGLPAGLTEKTLNPSAMVRLERHGDHISGWCVVSERPGRVKLKNPVIHRRAEVADAIDRELMTVLGIDRYAIDTFFSTVTVDYDPRQLTRSQVVEILDGVLVGTDIPTKLDKLDLSLAICTASLPLAAAAQFAFPPLLPVSAALFAYTSIPCFKGSYDLIFKEKRLGCDVLDAIVVIGCLSTMQLLPGAILCWCLSFGRTLVKRTEDSSKKMLLNVFGKQPRFVWVVKDTIEVQIPMHELQQGDVIVVNTGEVMPVDGIVVEGIAMIDQHALTGESTPAEKGIGDRVFASTVMVAGKLFVAVESSGAETASAKIGKILADTAGLVPWGMPRWGRRRAWRSSTAIWAPASAWLLHWRCSVRSRCVPVEAFLSRMAAPSN